MEREREDRCRTCVHFKEDKCHSPDEEVCNGWTHHKESWWVTIKGLLFIFLVMAMLLGPTLLFIKYIQVS